MNGPGVNINAIVPGYMATVMNPLWNVTKAESNAKESEMNIAEPEANGKAPEPSGA